MREGRLAADAASVRRPLIVIAMTALATGVFALSAATFSAPPNAVDVPGNHVGTGALRLDLSGGPAGADLSFTGLMPGQTRVQRVWLAGNSPTSAVGGVLTMRLDRLRDVAGPCATSTDKARAEQAAGIRGCRVRGSTATGTPAQGNLSRLVSLELRAAPIVPPDTCSDADGVGSVVVPGAAGNIRTLAERTTHLSATRPDLLLTPGQGVCVVVTLGWPSNTTSLAGSDREHPTDNAAQGDSLRVRAMFNLSQVAP